MDKVKLSEAIAYVDQALSDYEEILRNNGSAERYEMVENFHDVYYSVTTKMLDEV